MVLDGDEIYMPPIFKLNEDCFEELFQYLDIDSLMNLLEVCKPLNTLVCKRGFKHIKSFEYNNAKDKPKATLAQMRRILKCIGEHIDDLQFTWDDHTQRFYEILGKYVGTNIRSAFFVINQLDERDVIAIRSIPENLTSLGLYMEKCEEHVDLIRSMCPNLKEVELSSIAMSVDCCKPWPQIQSIATVFFAPEILRTYLQRNQQITNLKFHILFNREYLKIVATHLRNVERLSVNSRHGMFEHVTGESLLPLISLHNLVEISLHFLNYHNLYDIFDCLKQFSTLRELQLRSDGLMNTADTKRIQQPIITLAQQLFHLERCAFFEIDLMSSTALEFIRFASNLKELHINCCSFKITQEFVLEVVEVLKSTRPQNDKALLKQCIYHCDRKDLEAIQKLDIRRYLCI